MFLFPAIDLRGGGVVRLHQGDYGKEKTYHHDPVEQARLFADAGAVWLHVVDLDGARSGLMANLGVIQKICAAVPTMKVEVGGGVRDTAAVDRLLDAGVHRAIVGTAALKNWPWFEAISNESKYHRRIVLGLDAREGKLAVGGWEQQTEASALEIAKKVSSWPLGAIVYTDIATDGTMEGPNVEATREISEATAVPVVASGGVGTLEHLRAIRKLSAVQGAIVGRAIYENRFSVAQAIDVLERGA